MKISDCQLYQSKISITFLKNKKYNEAVLIVNFINLKYYIFKEQKGEVLKFQMS